MFEEILEALEHTAVDTLKLLPLLFLTYLLMEYLEHRTGDRTQKMVQKTGKLGPLFGAAVGLIPQCGFSAAAANLYAGRVISMGTLLAIFLSTSDEMIPILLAQPGALSELWKILLLKVVIACIAGFMIDFLLRGKHEEHTHIHELCEHEHCNCEKGVVRSAFVHTLHIALYIFAISFVLHIVIHMVGEDSIAGLILNRPVLGPVLSGIVGLIPNCASSVVITQLYIEGAMGLGSMMAGLLVGAGVGILVLLRVNEDKKESLKIIGLLYAIGVVAGILLELLL